MWPAAVVGAAASVVVGAAEVLADPELDDPQAASPPTRSAVERARSRLFIGNYRSRPEHPLTVRRSMSYCLTLLLTRGNR